MSPRTRARFSALANLFGGSEKSQRSKRKAFAKRSLSIEGLEGRALLAATDLAAITGRVFRDMDHDNAFDSGEQVSGATVTLYHDDGDGVFDGGDSVEGNTTTNSQGIYQFDNITAGSYFVVQAANTNLGLDEKTSALITFNSTEVQGVEVLPIDSFDTTAQSASATPGSPGSANAPAPEAIGDRRKLNLVATGGQIGLEIDGSGNSANKLAFDSDFTATGIFTVTYDGSSGATLNPTGLGGIDLTEDGATGLSLVLGADQPAGTLIVRVYSSATNFSEAEINIPQVSAQNPLSSVYIPFDDFDVAGVTGANFSNVGAIQLIIQTATQATDGQVDNFGAIGPTVKTANFVNEVVDLALTKTVDVSTPNKNGNVTFTITVTNTGGLNATGVQVTDVLPAGLTFVSANPSSAYNSTTGVWTIGDLDAGDLATLTIVATVTTRGPKTNTAEVTNTDQPDVDSTPDNDDEEEDDQDSVTVTPRVADLSLTKSVNDTTPIVGENVTFTLVLSNVGPDAATNVTVTDLLPAGLTFVSSTLPNAYNSSTGVWTVGTVASGSSATLQIVATVATVGVKTNMAQVTASDQFDSDSTPNNNVVTEDDQASAVVTAAAAEADLSLLKSVNNATPNLGDNATFTLTLSNAGPVTATNVAVSDQLPAGLTFVSANASQGSYNSTTGIWTVGSVNSGANATLSIVATVATVGAKTNIAQVSSSDQPDPDSTPNNNVSGEDDQASALVTPVAIDLALTKTISTSTPSVGSNVTYTLTLTNGGPSQATNVRVTDQLPTGLTFVSKTESQGTYDSATGIWNVGTVNVSGTATLAIVATVTTSGGKTNTAQVTDVDQTDTDSTPNNNVTSEDDQASAALTTPRRLSKRLYLAR